jgi:hypothetical protein
MSRGSSGGTIAAEEAEDTERGTDIAPLCRERPRLGYRIGERASRSSTGAEMKIEPVTTKSDFERLKQQER